MPRIIICFLLLGVTGLTEAKDVLRLGYVEFRPLVVTGENDKPRGQVIDLIEKTLAHRYQIEWLNIPIGRIQWGFENVIIDGFPMLLRSKQREEYAEYFADPLYTIQSALCSKPPLRFDPDAMVSVADQLNGKTVISVLNSITFPFASDNRINHLKLPYDSYAERSYGLIAQNRADLVFVPVGSIFEEQVKQGKLECEKLGAKISVYFAFAKGNRFAAGVEASFTTVPIREF